MIAASPNHIPSPTVLIVDDEVFIRFMLSDLFEEAGYSVLEASNAAEAIGVLSERAGAVDLMVSDIRMPGERDGLDLASWASEHWPETKVILMSAYYEGQQVSGSHRHHGFVRKPFTPPHMLKLAETLLCNRAD